MTSRAGLPHATSSQKYSTQNECSRVSDKHAGGNEHTGCNFSKINSKKIIKKGKISEINKCAGGDKAVQVGNFRKINNLCSTFIRYYRLRMRKNTHEG